MTPKYTSLNYGETKISFDGEMVDGTFSREDAKILLQEALELNQAFKRMDVAMEKSMKEVK